MTVNHNFFGARKTDLDLKCICGTYFWYSISGKIYAKGIYLPKMIENHKIPQLSCSCSGWHTAAISTRSDKYISKLFVMLSYSEYFEKSYLYKKIRLLLVRL